jgi:hypothetical protein
MKTKVTRNSFLVALCGGAILLAGGCATTQYGGTEVSKLADPQLIEELASAERELGVQTDYRNALSSIDTSPRPVVTSASTRYSGNFNAQYNSANQTLYGSFNGSGYTTYQYVDANGGARFGQALALLINASKTAKLEDRRRAVLTEISHRRDARENMERISGQFLAAHPDIAANRDLLIACLLITQHRTSDPLEQLQQAGEIMRTLPKDRWIGWVEAHGNTNYPYGVVVGSYVMDATWDGDTLTGKGKASDGSEMNLTAKRNQAGMLDGTIRSQTMEARFVGRMNDTALCLDYKGWESGHQIRGITWAFRTAETKDLQTVSASVGHTQSGTFSGRYVGNGKAVNNGVEQPYQITLDVVDSGDITFSCTAVVSGQEAVVRGRGTVDSNGNVTIQNEFGATGHGTISGNILKAGGQNADGSVHSYFEAQKQK